MRPFVASAADCQAPPHLAYSEEPGSPFREGAEEVVERVADASEANLSLIQHWKDEPAQSFSPPGHFVAVALELSAQHRLTLDQALIMTTRLALTMADAAIRTWAVKYETYLLRPETYIRRMMNPAYRPLIVTPAFPAYPSGHATFAGAASPILIAALGDVPFIDNCGARWQRPARSFESISQATEECAGSRVMAGIHFPMDEVGGLELGRCVAKRHLEQLSFDASSR